MLNTNIDNIKRKIHLKLIRINTFLREKRRWRNAWNDQGEIKLFYGHDYLPTQKEIATGGIVKCQDLNRLYPNCSSRPSVLYLVSSALPHYPHYMIKYAKRKGVKLVWNQNGVAYPAWHGPGWEAANSILKFGLQNADYVIYQSEFCKESSDRYLGGFSGENSILYNPVDTEVFKPQNSSFEKFKILVAGSHHERYRIELALEAFAKVSKMDKDVELTIAGPLKWIEKGELAYKDLLGMCDKIGLSDRVKITGPYTQKQAREIIADHHILLHTQYNDSCPRLVVEAMACGLAVVYSKSGGTPELVGDEAGVGIDVPRSWEKIYLPDRNEMAKGLFRTMDRYSHYSPNARKRAVEKLDVEAWLVAHTQIFEKIMAC